MIPQHWSLPHRPSLVGLLQHPPWNMSWIYTIPTFLTVFVRRMTWSKRPARTSNKLYSLSGRVESMRTSSEYKYAARSMIARPSTPVHTYVGVTTVTQWRMTESTTTLKIVGNRGSPCVTPQYPLNGRTKYPLELSNMVSCSQYVRRSLSLRGSTLYAARSSRDLSWSKAL